MLRAGDVIENPMTGERVVVIEGSADTGGEYLLGELIVSPGGQVVGEHIHDTLDETFEVLSGRISVRLDGRDSELHEGGRAFVPRGTAHDWWNDSGETAVVRVRVEPAGRFEEMLTTVFALGRSGRTNAKGMPGPLQLAVFAREFESTLRLTKPPRIVQRIVFAILAPIARMRGYSGVVPYGEPGHLDLAARRTA
jgi:quercetin dioxygenase-like cupin family protein